MANEKTGKQPSPAALEKILGYLDRGYSPALVGFIALEIGYSLAQTETMLDILEDRGLVRKVPVAELRKRSIDERCVMYERVPR